MKVEVLIAPMHGDIDPPPIAIILKVGPKTLARVEMTPADFALAITGRLVHGTVTKGALLENAAPRPATVASLKPEDITVLSLAATVDPDILPMPYEAVYRAVGDERAWTILNRLRNLGLMAHPRYNAWAITEKGRITLALHRAAAAKAM